MSTNTLAPIVCSEAPNPAPLNGNGATTPCRPEELIQLLGGQLDSVGDTATNTPQVEPTTYFRYKVLLMRALGCLFLIPASPVILALSALIRATSSGPALYRQVRVGKDGREFALIKLRTMYQDAEKLTGPVWCRQNDSRVTPVGKILRHLHLDELPQLWNVVRGDMDLVGPRPERPKFVREFRSGIPNYENRHKVRPGITGLAQVNLPADETIESVQRKLVLDLEYINTARLGIDLRILVCTALRMCGLRNGRAVRMFRLERMGRRKAENEQSSYGVLRLRSANGRSLHGGNGYLAPQYASNAAPELSPGSNGANGCGGTSSTASVARRPK